MLDNRYKQAPNDNILLSWAASRRTNSVKLGQINAKKVTLPSAYGGGDGEAPDDRRNITRSFLRRFGINVGHFATILADAFVYAIDGGSADASDESDETVNDA